MPNKRLLRHLILPLCLLDDPLSDARRIMGDLDTRAMIKKSLQKALKDAAKHPGEFTPDQVAITTMMLDFIRFLDAQSN